MHGVWPSSKASISSIKAEGGLTHLEKAASASSVGEANRLCKVCLDGLVLVGGWRSTKQVEEAACSVLVEGCNSVGGFSLVQA